ncbi:Uncharacterised protein [Legionella busanensis]|uniref:Uncharacterized protein n=1 Tax=Legionella busanensis TaxID=190655 RepID=A0A378JJB9_9GAMM|nr:hypothetical protein [Legionella busanensis]STX50851.1 Uncharacterised protein [Legionella busanensis]
MTSSRILKLLLEGFGFHQIISYTPYHLKSILKVTKVDADIANLVAEALIREMEEHWNGWELVDYFCPEYLQKILDVLEKHIAGPAIIAILLAKKDDNYISTLEKMLIENKIDIIKVLNIAFQFKKATPLLQPLLSESLKKYPKGAQVYALIENYCINSLNKKRSFSTYSNTNNQALNLLFSSESSNNSWQQRIQRNKIDDQNIFKHPKII